MIRMMSALALLASGLPSFLAGEERAAPAPSATAAMIGADVPVYLGRMTVTATALPDSGS